LNDNLGFQDSSIYDSANFTSTNFSFNKILDAKNNTFYRPADFKKETFFIDAKFQPAGTKVREASSCSSFVEISIAGLAMFENVNLPEGSDIRMNLFDNVLVGK
jgi:hypothetical protein